MRLQFTLIASALLALTCLAAPRSDDLAVLRAVVKHHCTDSSGAYFVLLTNTAKQSSFESGAIPSDSAAARDLIRRNRMVQQLPLGLECRGIRVATEEEVTAALAEHCPDPDPLHRGWEGFYARFSGSRGVLRLSLPGYSHNGTEAVVLSSAASGVRFASGFLITLRKDHGEWKVVRSTSLWIS
jgi:hypothetical protein